MGQAAGADRLPWPDLGGSPGSGRAYQATHQEDFTAGMGNQDAGEFAETHLSVFDLREIFWEYLCVVNHD
jgi:hypothetical protein